MSNCQKCKRPIGDTEPRWMYTPELPVKLRFDKCQACGNWTTLEQVTAAHKVMQHLQTRGSAPLSDCNCTGKR